MACSSLADEALVIIEESKKDDDVDADGDGKADVKQIGNREYALRKTRLVMAKMNPTKVDSAVASIYNVWLAVAAVLKIQFARTINMALGIAEFINKPVDRFLRPTIQIVVPDEYDRWVPVVLSWITKSIAMSIAWYIQTVILAATSAMQGGLQMARALMRMGRKKGVKFLPADHETYIDEVAAYIFAGLGFYFQFSLHFDVPFPFNWLLWPFELAGGLYIIMYRTSMGMGVYRTVSHFTRAFSWAFEYLRFLLSNQERSNALLLPFISVFILCLAFRVVDPLDHHQGRLMIPNSHTRYI